MNEYKEDPLAAWLNRELRLNIDGNELIVKPVMKHYRQLKAIQRRGIEKKDKLTEQDLLKLMDEEREIHKDILKTTFPDSQVVDDFLDRYELQFKIALYIALGWGTKESFDELRKKVLEGVGGKELKS